MKFASLNSRFGLGVKTVPNSFLGLAHIMSVFFSRKRTAREKSTCLRSAKYVNILILLPYGKTV